MNACFMCIYREYLATFKKTVAMHETFLKRLAAHPTLRNDHNYQVFLEFSGDVSQPFNFVVCLSHNYTKALQSCMRQTVNMVHVYVISVEACEHS